MPEKSKVIVVMPAYNEEEHVVEQIEAVREVLEETDWTFQIVLVDDGSSDDTADRAESAGVSVIRHRITSDMSSPRSPLLIR